MGNEKYGDVSAWLFGAWRMKKVQTDMSMEESWEEDQAIIKEVMEAEDLQEVGAESDDDVEDLGDVLMPDHEKIKRRAERYSLEHCRFLLYTHNPCRFAIARPTMYTNHVWFLQHETRCQQNKDS